MTKGEDQLIEEAQRGNADSFGQLVKRYQHRLYGAMTHVVGCPAEAEDVVQEAFLHAFLNLNRFRGQSKFYTWLYRIAFHRSVDLRRKARSAKTREAKLGDGGYSPIAPSVSPSAPLELLEQNERVNEALGSLSEEYRAILILREFEGFDYAAIANTMGINMGTVRSRLHRARMQLRRAMLKLEDLADTSAID